MMKNRHIEGSVDSVGFSVIVEIVVKAPGERDETGFESFSKMGCLC